MLGQAAEEETAKTEVTGDMYEVIDRPFSEEAAAGEVAIDVYEVGNRLLSEEAAVGEVGSEVYKVEERLLSEEATFDKTLLVGEPELGVLLVDWACSVDEEVLKSLEVEEGLEIKLGDAVDAERDEGIKATRDEEVIVDELDRDGDVERLVVESFGSELGKGLGEGLVDSDSEDANEKEDPGDWSDVGEIVEKATFGEKSVEEDEEKAKVDASSDVGDVAEDESMDDPDKDAMSGPSMIPPLPTVYDLCTGTAKSSKGSAYGFEDPTMPTQFTF